MSKSLNDYENIRIRIERFIEENGSPYDIARLKENDLQSEISTKQFTWERFSKKRLDEEKEVIIEYYKEKNRNKRDDEAFSDSGEEIKSLEKRNSNTGIAYGYLVDVETRAIVDAILVRLALEEMSEKMNKGTMTFKEYKDFMNRPIIKDFQDEMTKSDKRSKKSKRLAKKLDNNFQDGLKMLGQLEAIKAKGQELEQQERHAKNLQYIDIMCEYFKNEELLKTEGLFRISASKKDIDSILEEYYKAKEESAKDQLLHNIKKDAHLFVGILKKILNDGSLFEKSKIPESIKKLEGYINNPKEQIDIDKTFWEDLEKLNSPGYNAIYKMFDLCIRTARHNKYNKMYIPNIAIAIAPNLLPFIGVKDVETKDFLIQGKMELQKIAVTANLLKSFAEKFYPDLDINSIMKAPTTTQSASTTIAQAKVQQQEKTVDSAEPLKPETLSAWTKAKKPKTPSPLKPATPWQKWVDTAKSVRSWFSDTEDLARYNIYLCNELDHEILKDYKNKGKLPVIIRNFINKEGQMYEYLLYGVKYNNNTKNQYLGVTRLSDPKLIEELEKFEKGFQQQIKIKADKQFDFIYATIRDKEKNAHVHRVKKHRSERMANIFKYISTILGVAAAASGNAKAIPFVEFFALPLQGTLKISQNLAKRAGMFFDPKPDNIFASESLKLIKKSRRFDKYSTVSGFVAGAAVIASFAFPPISPAGFVVAGVGMLGCNIFKLVSTSYELHNQRTEATHDAPNMKLAAKWLRVGYAVTGTLASSLFVSAFPMAALFPPAGAALGIGVAVLSSVSAACVISSTACNELAEWKREIVDKYGTSVKTGGFSYWDAFKYKFHISNKWAKNVEIGGHKPKAQKKTKSKEEDFESNINTQPKEVKPLIMSRHRSKQEENQKPSDSPNQQPKPPSSHPR